MDKIDSESTATETANDYVRFIQFDLGTEGYAIQLLMVKEVIPVADTTHIPNSPSHYVGIMNLRGQIISIVDLRKKLNIKPKTEGLEEAVIIVEYDGIGIGVIVDSINKVLNIGCKEVTEVPEVNTQVNAKYIQGVYQGEDSLTIMLDLENILNINEIKNMQKKAS